MPGATPIYQYPYPTGTDRVADGDNAMQALAERVEAVNNAPATYTDFPFVNGWASNLGNPCRYAKKMGVVYFSGVMLKAAWATDEVIGHLPAGFRPGIGVPVAAWADHMIWIETNGQVTIRTPTTGGGFYFSVSFPAAS